MDSISRVPLDENVFTWDVRSGGNGSGEPTHCVIWKHQVWGDLPNVSSDSRRRSWHGVDEAKLICQTFRSAARFTPAFEAPLTGVERLPRVRHN